MLRFGDFGTLGIGTTAPGYNLDVTGNIHSSGILYLSQEDFNSQIITDFTWRIGEASEDIILHTWSAGLGDYLLLRGSAGQEEFTISDSQGFLFANGNVGIRISYPLFTIWFLYQTMTEYINIDGL